MVRDHSRLAAVLGELANLGRQISDRASELAGLMNEVGEAVPADLTDRVADVHASTAVLAATAAGAATATDTTTPAALPADAAPRQRTDATQRARRVRHASTPRRQSRSRSRTAATVTGARRPLDLDGKRRFRPFIPAAVSTAVNVGVILGMAIFFIAAEAKPKRPVLTLAAAEEQFVDEMTPVELVTTDEPPVGLDQTDAPLPELTPLTTDPLAIDDVSVDAMDLAVDATAVMPASFETVDMLADVGGSGGSGDEAGESARGGGPASEGQPGSGSFFGRQGTGHTVCFICDNSNSYRDGGFHTVLDELARAVESLRPDQSFFVVFFSDDAYPMFHPERVDGLQPASPDNKRRLRAWLATVEMCGGGQGIDEAVKLAGGLGADVVYFLSDGEHAASVVERIASADFGGAVVHTFGVQQGVLDRRTGQLDPGKFRRQQDCDRNLVAIATAHGGGFTPVLVPPQAAMLERLRPIHRNRTPGPVWGSKL